MKEEALDSTLWRTRFGRGCGYVLRETTEWINESIMTLNKVINTLFYSGWHFICWSEFLKIYEKLKYFRIIKSSVTKGKFKPFVIVTQSDITVCNVSVNTLTGTKMQMFVLSLNRWRVIEVRRELTYEKLRYETKQQSLYMPWGFQEVDSSIFQDSWHMKVVQLSALLTRAFTPQEIFVALISVQPHHLYVPNVIKSGSLNLLEPSGPHRTCYGTPLPFTYFC
jgi:hypothetical protein